MATTMPLMVEYLFNQNIIRVTNEPSGSITQTGRVVTFDDTYFTLQANGRDIEYNGG